MSVRDPGSFRDPRSRVLSADGRVLRCFDPQGATEFRAAVAAGLLDRLAASGLVAGWTEVTDDVVREVTVAPSAPFVIEHPRIPFVSYPYEWPFAMLKAAALLTLDVQSLALDHGFVLKDATPYNVAFVGTRPVMIDLGSFEPAHPGEPWAAYAQFCRLFLFPLLLESELGLPFQPWLRGRLDGIGVHEVRRALAWRAWRRRMVFRHVTLQAWLDRSSLATAGRANLEAASVTATAQRRFLDRLRHDVATLQPRVTASPWLGYDSEPEVTAARAGKEALVEAALAAGAPGMVWDLGCNTGRYSRLAARQAGYVVAMDADAAVVHGLATEAHATLLPLVIDVLNPSPDQGWAQAERRGLGARGPADVVLCLGLLHHLVIRGAVPLLHVTAWLASLAPRLVLEWIPPDDPGVHRLLRWRASAHHPYDRTELESALRGRFANVSSAPIAGSPRALYLASGA